jgi:hypothetical protein
MEGVERETIETEADDERPHMPWDDDEHRVMSCRACGLPRVFTRRKTRHSMHFLISLATLCVWLPFWALVILHQALKPWTCSVCGRRQRNG